MRTKNRQPAGDGIPFRDRSCSPPEITEVKPVAYYEATNDLELAHSLNDLGCLYNDEGRYETAIPLLKRALAIKERLLRADNLEVATSADNLEVAYAEAGEYSEAEPLATRALATREKLEPGSLDAALSLNNLGLIFKHEGRYLDAEQLYRRSLTVRVKLLGPDHPLVSATLDNLANLLEEQDRYAEAEPLYRRAVEITGKRLGVDHPNVAIALGNLAQMYEAEGQYQRAEGLFVRALDIRNKRLAPDDPNIAISLTNLGALYEEEARYSDAQKNYEAAMAILDRHSVTNLSLIPPLLNNLAIVYQDERRYDDAENTLLRSLKLSKERDGPSAVSVAEGMINLSSLYKRRNRYADAENQSKGALDIIQQKFGPDHSETGTTVSNLALLYYAWKRPRDAEHFFTIALANRRLQFQKQFPHMSERERLAFRDQAGVLVSVYLSFAMSYKDQLPEVTKNAYDLLLWSKGLVAQSVAVDRARIAAAGDIKATTLFDELTAKRRELAAMAKRVPENRDAWMKSSAELQEQCDDLEQDLARRSAIFSEAKRVADSSWRDVQAVLGPQDAAIEYVRFRFNDGVGWTDRSYYAALIVTKRNTGPIMVVLPNGAADLDGPLLDDYVALVSGPADRVVSSADLGRAFTHGIWDPLEPTLIGIRRVYVAPDGSLDAVALGVLPLSGNRGLLMQSFDLRLVLGTRDLIRPRNPKGLNTALLLGNPELFLKPPQQQAIARAVREGATPWHNGSQNVERSNTAGSSLASSLSLLPSFTDSDVRGLQVKMTCRDSLSGDSVCSLPETQREVEWIYGKLKTHNWSVSLPYVGEWALKEAVMATRHPRLLHLATHGFFPSDRRIDSNQLRFSIPDEDSMLNSGLLFAGAANDKLPKGLGNGILTAFEASMLDLHGTELVVLSACGSAWGTCVPVRAFLGSSEHCKRLALKQFL